MNENAKVVLLACSKVDWVNCSQFIQSTYNFKMIGDDNTNEYSLFSLFLKRIKPLSNPHKYLFLTFGLKTTKKVFMQLVEFDEFKIWSDIHDEDYMLIVAGSFESWTKSIEKFCLKESDFAIRVLLNKVFLFLERGCPSAIKEWHKVSLPDGSFIVQRREIHA